ncbi:MAG: SAM-dependent methyltransferase [Sporichthyaceae bacterium]
MSLPADYFARMYAVSEDPWGFRSRWYEERKRAVTLAVLDRPRYRAAFEPGCSVGVLTTALADRCERLLATDVDPTAVAATQAAVADRPHVTVEQRSVPADWPAGEFDLVVVSELGYYLDAPELGDLVDRTLGALAPGGSLLLCHWRHPVDDYPLPGDAVHERFRAEPALVAAVRHEEADFLLDLVTLGRTDSPARREGLTP